VAINLAAVGAVGAPELARTHSPLEQAARGVGGQTGAVIIGLGATTAMLGVLLSQILGISRMLFAMARRGDLPAFFARVDPTRQIPDLAVLFTGAVILAVALFGTLEWVVQAATFTILLYYSLTNLAALRLAPERKRFPDWVAVVGLIFCLVMAAALKPVVIASGLAVLVVGYASRAVIRVTTKAPPALN
jgi:APA family basic amino acid/polyamine antiporter